MKYQRIEQRNGYQHVTIVDTEGNYEQFNKWGDGKITAHFKTTLQKMGWNSTKEFLGERSRFKKVVTTNAN